MSDEQVRELSEGTTLCAEESKISNKNAVSVNQLAQLGKTLLNTADKGLDTAEEIAEKLHADLFLTVGEEVLADHNENDPQGGATTKALQASDVKRFTDKADRPAEKTTIARRGERFSNFKKRTQSGFNKRKASAAVGKLQKVSTGIKVTNAVKRSFKTKDLKPLIETVSSEGLSEPLKKLGNAAFRMVCKVARVGFGRKMSILFRIATAVGAGKLADAIGERLAQCYDIVKSKVFRNKRAVEVKPEEPMEDSADPGPQEPPAVSGQFGVDINAVRKKAVNSRTRFRAVTGVNNCPRCKRRIQFNILVPKKNRVVSTNTSLICTQLSATSLAREVTKDE